MTPTQLLAYQYIKNNPGVSALDIASFTGRDYSQLRTLLSQMSYNGLIRNKSKNGKRSSYFIDKRRKVNGS